MNIAKLFSQIKKKVVNPKAYAVVLFDEMGMARTLWHGVAYSLDEVIDEAKKFSLKSFPGAPTHLWKPILWSAVDLLDFVNKGISVTLQVENTREDAIALMKTIIETKNRALFEDNRHEFTPEEVKLIEEKLKL